jgi:hypothetical protein
MLPADPDRPLGGTTAGFSSSAHATTLAHLQSGGLWALQRIPARELAILTTPRPITAHQATILRVETPRVCWQWLDQDTYTPWAGYVFTVIGNQADRGWTPERPGFAAWLASGQAVLLAAWYLAAAAVGGTFYAEITWTPEHGTQKAIRELQPIWHQPTWRDRDLAHAGAAMRLLHLVQRGEGRPPEYDPSDPNDLVQLRRTFAHAIDAILNRGERPSQRQLAAYLGWSRNTVKARAELVNLPEIEARVRKMRSKSN